MHYLLPMETNRTELAPVTIEIVEAWVATAQRTIVDPRDAASNLTTRTVLAVDKGRRYARIKKTLLNVDGEQVGGYYAHMFVDLTTGGIHPPRGWKSPVKYHIGHVNSPVTPKTFPWGGI